MNEAAKRRIARIQASHHSQPSEQENQPAWKAGLKAVAVPVLVTVIGGWFAQGIALHYGKQQRLIAQKEAEEKFITYLDPKKSNPQQRYLAIQSLVDLQAYDTAADLLVTLPHDYARLTKKIEDADDKKNAVKQSEDVKHHGESDAGPAVVDPFDCASSPGEEAKTDQQQEDCNFASLLFRYQELLLPRLFYRAGNRDDPYSERSIQAIGVVLQRTGLALATEIAFTPGVRDASWWQQGRFWLDTAWLKLFGSPEEIAFQRNQRRGAILAIEGLIRAERSSALASASRQAGRGLGGLVRLDQIFSRLQDSRYASLATLLLRVVKTEDAFLYDEAGRRAALITLKLFYKRPGEPYRFLNELRVLASNPTTPDSLRTAVVQQFLGSGSNIDQETVKVMRQMIANGLCDTDCAIWFISTRQQSVRDSVLARLANGGDGANTLIAKNFRSNNDVPDLVKLYAEGSSSRRQAILEQLPTLLQPPDQFDEETGEVVEGQAGDICGQNKSAEGCRLVTDGMEDQDQHVRESAYDAAFHLGTTAWKSARSRLERESDPQVLTWFLVHEWGESDETGDHFDCALLDTLKTRIDAIDDKFKKAVPRPYLSSRTSSCGEGKKKRKPRNGGAKPNLRP